MDTLNLVKEMNNKREKEKKTMIIKAFAGM